MSIFASSVFISYHEASKTRNAIAPWKFNSPQFFIFKVRYRYLKIMRCLYRMRLKFLSVASLQKMHFGLINLLIQGRLSAKTRSRHSCIALNCFRDYFGEESRCWLILKQPVHKTHSGNWSRQIEILKFSWTTWRFPSLHQTCRP